MTELVAMFTMTLIPLALIITLIGAAYAAIAVIDDAVSFYRARRVQLHAVMNNESFKGNHRTGTERRRQTDRRHYHADRRRVMTT